MNNDLISRQAAIEAINELHDKPNAWLDLAVDVLEDLPSAQPEPRWTSVADVFEDIAKNRLETWIDLIPTADVAEAKHGKWIWMGEKGDSRFMCSVCKSKEDVPTCNGEPTIWWYCPNCGADMRKEIEDED